MEFTFAAAMLTMESLPVDSGKPPVMTKVKVSPTPEQMRIISLVESKDACGPFKIKDAACSSMPITAGQRLLLLTYGHTLFLLQTTS